jgi:hypothetical protein
VKLLHQISSLADEETLKANFSSCWSISLFCLSYLLAKFFHQIWRVWWRNTKHFPFYQSISLFRCLSCLQVKFCNQMSRGWWRNTKHFCLCFSSVSSKGLSPNVKRLMLCTYKCIYRCYCTNKNSILKGYSCYQRTQEYMWTQYRCESIWMQMLWTLFPHLRGLGNGDRPLVPNV